MSQIAGTPVEVTPDTDASKLTIRTPGVDVAFKTEEVISFLKSPSLELKTRRKIAEIVPMVCETGIALYVRFKDAWDYRYEIDVLDALKALFVQKGYRCV